ncbi:MAG: hypothetical protein COA50_08775 [Flavobacteriaceae bacterium]|nr:MAG: hypothetical protein COA50_08775 [Flavobacteriaceae bacterium]
MKKRIVVLAVLSLFTISVVVFSNTLENMEIAFQIRGFQDVEYPSNPDFGFRSSGYQEDFFRSGILKKNENSLYDIKFQTNKKGVITLNNIDLSSWIPTIPDQFHENEYLTQIALVNQEWNRNQVAFGEHEFSSDFKKIKRIDLARNCLNSYLWEVMAYTEEDNKLLPYAHGWFNFPKDVYQELFLETNQRSFQEFAAYLEQWKTAENKEIKKELLHKEMENISVTYKDLSDAMYPIEGERAKKINEIIAPKVFTSMRALQTDSTLFATFSPPGIYEKSSPRKTELGRLFQLDTLMLRKSKLEEDGLLLHEMEIIFKDKNGNRITKLILGGLDFTELKALSEEEAHMGWQNSMGFGNHSFYESYAKHIQANAKNNPYYAYLTDENDNWLDSHQIGIDGPLLHFDTESKNKIHLWLLSFERHALVGHYTLEW